ncbi:helix-turn-helix domain-containing protein [Streptomyces virginiae]|uniref:helix-turn-helix domain-containing protein n=1 Tax=Streptomyces TaxID=1883 RepID=UPI0007C76B23|nr:MULTISPECIES: helix-turn-helix transcriptional regulator [Streptomyces]MCM9080091.1 helix-turn-helix domain-containing protein [Streptomyces spororaveus]MCX5305502.1 helix-turn-helix domain-containing protein [Streptomyces sp. NBC_00160]WKV73492.1 helix-turn-helix domain-containing protein [Streptomyces sp. PCS3-D2]WSC78160.1 helix-turn-helix domain-containing protein [Streptomyces virginiae]
MPRSSNDKQPRDYVVDGAWPNAALAPDAPVSAYYGQSLSRNLARAMSSTGHTLRSLAAATGLTHSTISRVLNGRVMPDSGTLARLEASFGFQIWPGPAALPPAPPES